MSHSTAVVGFSMVGESRPLPRSSLYTTVRIMPCEVVGMDRAEGEGRGGFNRELKREIGVAAYEAVV